jgi:hypothetical protein
VQEASEADKLLYVNIQHNALDNCYDPQDVSEEVDHLYGPFESVADIRSFDGLSFGDVVSFHENKHMKLFEAAELNDCTIDEYQKLIDDGEITNELDGNSDAYIYIGDNQFLRPDDITKGKFKALKELRKLIKSEAVSFEDILEDLKED